MALACAHGVVNKPGGIMDAIRWTEKKRANKSGDCVLF
jgi:hypothetical protein